MPKGIKGFQKGHKFGNRFQKGHITWCKGTKGLLKHTEEWKEKMSEKMKGNKYALGMKHTEEWKKRMSLIHKGKKMPESFIIRMTGENNPAKRKEVREKLSGENHWNWQGGKRKRRDERNDSLYHLWVKQVKKRDKNECVFKGQNCSGYNIVHHILSWKDYPELRYEIKNGITLCQFHHPRKRVEEQKLIPVFLNLVGLKEII